MTKNKQKVPVKTFFEVKKQMAIQKTHTQLGGKFCVRGWGRAAQRPPTPGSCWPVWEPEES